MLRLAPKGRAVVITTYQISRYLPMEVSVDPILIKKHSQKYRN